MEEIKALSAWGIVFQKYLIVNLGVNLNSNLGKPLVLPVRLEKV